MKISFIGFGNMAKAIAEGLSQNSIWELSAAAPALADEISPQGVKTHYNNRAILGNAEVVILAVKPAMMSQVLQEIESSLPPNCLLISIAAGLTLEKLAKHCQPNQPIVRCMPNTPLAVGKGASALIANNFVTPQQKNTAEVLFQSAGIVRWITNEKEMNAITALSGSGPAYFFFMIEAMTHAAQKLGIDAQIAEDFAKQTALGAVSLLEASTLSPKELRQNVTSPKGTTEAALAILQGNKFEDLIFKTLQAAYERAQEIENTY